MTTHTHIRKKHLCRCLTLSHFTCYKLNNSMAIIFWLTCHHVHQSKSTHNSFATATVAVLLFSFSFRVFFSFFLMALAVVSATTQCAPWKQINENYSFTYTLHMHTRTFDWQWLGANRLDGNCFSRRSPIIGRMFILDILFVVYGDGKFNVWII